MALDTFLSTKLERFYHAARRASKPPGELIFWNCFPQLFGDILNRTTLQMDFKVVNHLNRASTCFLKHMTQIVYNFTHAPVAQWIERLTSDNLRGKIIEVANTRATPLTNTHI